MSKIQLNFAQKQCVAAAGKLMQQTGMLYPGARVGVAASGGMDSWVLLQVLLLRQRIVPFHFEIMVLHINPGFDPTNHAPLQKWVTEQGLAAHIEVSDHGLVAHSKENRRNSPCFYCAMQRRKRLFTLCQKYHLSHLAFGHNADDLVSTFYMNLHENGRVEGMNMCEDFFGGALKVIRPLMFVEKNTIRKAVKAWELPLWTNPCPTSSHTRRSEVLQDVMALCKDSPATRRHIFNGLMRWQFQECLAKQAQQK